MVLGWEALVDKLVLVVHEVTVGLEVVLLAVEELVQLHEPARVSVLAIWLRANVNVAVILDIFDLVVHVLRGVDFIVLALAVTNFPKIGS